MKSRLQILAGKYDGSFSLLKARVREAIRKRRAYSSAWDPGDRAQSEMLDFLFSGSVERQALATALVLEHGSTTDKLNTQCSAPEKVRSYIHAVIADLPAQEKELSPEKQRAEDVARRHLPFLLEGPGGFSEKMYDALKDEPFEFVQKVSSRLYDKLETPTQDEKEFCRADTQIIRERSRSLALSLLSEKNLTSENVQKLSEPFHSEVIGFALASVEEEGTVSQRAAVLDARKKLGGNRFFFREGQIEFDFTESSLPELKDSSEVLRVVSEISGIPIRENCDLICENWVQTIDHRIGGKDNIVYECRTTGEKTVGHDAVRAFCERTGTPLPSPEDYLENPETRPY